MTASIKRISARAAREARPTATPAHMWDESNDAAHLGAFVDERLVGTVSAFGVGIDGLPSIKQWLIHGPFGEHTQQLMASLIERAPRGTTLWAPNTRPMLMLKDDVWAVTTPSKPKPKPKPEPEPEPEPGKYSAADIEVLTGLMPIRRRPHMYVGCGPVGAAQQLIRAAVFVGLSGADSGRVHNIDVQIGEDGVVTVTDDGPGLPIQDGRLPIIESLTHWPSRWSTRGVGTFAQGHPSIVSALSEFMEVETSASGRRRLKVFRHGLALTPLLDIGATGHEYLRLRFRPDFTLLEASVPTLQSISEMVRELSLLNSGIALRLNGELLQTQGGLRQMAEELLAADPLASMAFDRTYGDMRVQIGVAKGAGTTHSLKFFADQSAIDRVKDIRVSTLLHEAAPDSAWAVAMNVSGGNGHLSTEVPRYLVGPPHVLEHIRTALTEVLREFSARC